jgi:hypothetical protein
MPPLRSLCEADLDLQQQIGPQRNFIPDFGGSSTVTTLLTGRGAQIGASGGIDGALAKIDTLRAEAFNLVSQAMSIASFEAQTTRNIDSALLSRFSTNKARYAETLKNAKKYSYLAKRAIEMRLGVSLADMHDDLPLVEAPATWESTVCEMTGIDFSKIRNPDLAGDGGLGVNGQGFNFSDEFIGTYVTRLGRL